MYTRNPFGSAEECKEYHVFLSIFIDQTLKFLHKNGIVKRDRFIPKNPQRVQAAKARYSIDGGSSS